MDIIDLLTPEAFINFAFANYPLLQANGMAPALSAPRMRYLTNNTRIAAWFPLLKLPPEINLQIIQHLKPLDIMRFVVANYQDLARQGIAPPLRPSTVVNLSKSVAIAGRGVAL